MALFNVLTELSPLQRAIIIDHLDMKTCNTLISAIKMVIDQGPEEAPPHLRKKLLSVMRKHGQELDTFLSKSKSLSSLSKKRHLARIGGNPLFFMLASAIPALINLFKK